MVAVAVVGGLATDTSSEWYRGLERPSWQPAEAPLAAGVEIVVLVAVIVALIALTCHSARAAAVALVPYAAWVAFAAALTWTIAASN